MRLIPKRSTFHKSVLLYRRIRHRRGFGVHSPFVFKLITGVIEEKGRYYSFNDIELLRKKLYYREDTVTFPDRHHKGKTRTKTIASIVRQAAIKPKHGALLFRLANYFKPLKILQVGPSVGLSTLYLTSYTSGVTCIALEKYPEFTAIAEMIYSNESRNPIQLKVGAYLDTIPAALRELDKPDLIYFNTLYEKEGNIEMFEKILPYLKPETVVIWKDIKMNRDMRRLWTIVKEHPKVTVTMDLYSFGIALFNPKLHKRNYKVYY